MTFAWYDVAPDAAPLHEHRHPQEEVWNVVSGRLAVTVEGSERVLGPGEVAIVPRGRAALGPAGGSLPRDRGRPSDAARRGAGAPGLIARGAPA